MLLQEWRTHIPATVATVARGSLIVADAIVIAVTWLTMRDQVKDTYLNPHMKTSMIMLADGV